ncbi:hypothetical protein Tco_0258109 [Tanacetum coccineum]
MDSEKEAQKPDKRLKRVAGSYATQKSPKKPKVMKSAKEVIEELTRADGRHDLMLWGDLRMIFEPDENNEIWKNQSD